MINIVAINALSACLMAAIFLVLPRKLAPSIRILSAFCACFLLLGVAQVGANSS